MGAFSCAFALVPKLLFGNALPETPFRVEAGTAARTRNRSFAKGRSQTGVWERARKASTIGRASGRVGGERGWAFLHYNGGVERLLPAGRRGGERRARRRLAVRNGARRLRGRLWATLLGDQRHSAPQTASCGTAGDVGAVRPRPRAVGRRPQHSVLSPIIVDMRNDNWRQWTIV
jgi:hypothetical protein